MGHVNAFQNDLGDNKIDVLLFKLNLFEKLLKVCFRNGSLSISFGSEGS